MIIPWQSNHLISAFIFLTGVNFSRCPVWPVNPPLRRASRTKSGGNGPTTTEPSLPSWPEPVLSGVGLGALLVLCLSVLCEDQQLAPVVAWQHNTLFMRIEVRVRFAVDGHALDHLAFGVAKAQLYPFAGIAVKT